MMQPLEYMLEATNPVYFLNLPGTPAHPAEAMRELISKMDDFAAKYEARRYPDKKEAGGIRSRLYVMDQRGVLDVRWNPAGEAIEDTFGKRDEEVLKYSYVMYVRFMAFPQDTAYEEMRDDFKFEFKEYLLDAYRGYHVQNRRVPAINKPKAGAKVMDGIPEAFREFIEGLDTAEASVGNEGSSTAGIAYNGPEAFREFIEGLDLSGLD